MEMQIIDVDYVLVDEKPTLRIFGRTRDGKAVTVFYSGYRPYFYTDRDPEYILRREPGVINMEKVTKRVVLEETDEKELLKVTLNNPARTPEIRDKLKNFGAKVYEADILFKYRFMADMGLFGMGWMAVDEGKAAITSSVTTEIKLEAPTLRPVQSEDNVPLMVAAFDIECTTAGRLPDPKKNEIILVSLVFSRPYKGKQSLVLSTRIGADLTYPDEKAMLEDFNRLIVDADPDIMTGFNCNNFDFPFITERMRALGVTPRFGRCTTKAVVARKVGIRYRVTVPGRVVLDVYELVKRDFSLQRYGLEFVAQALLKEKKEDVRHSQIEKFWRGTAEEFQRLVTYSRQDSVLVMNLLQKLFLADKYIALSKIAGTLLQDTLDGGQTIKIENYALREFNKNNYIFPVRPEDAEMARREDAKKKELVGGYVIEPDKGLHSSVVVLDFKSMYPSIIRSFNICPTTIIKGVVPAGVVPVVSPVNAKFYPKEVREGIIPAILGTLMSKRQAVKKKLKKCEDPNLRRSMDAEQWAFKILANAFYGYMGYSRARLYDLDVANSITAFGRDIIQSTVKKITDRFGFRVVYGDTDSVFVKVPDEKLEDIYTQGVKVSAEVNKGMPGQMEMEFEKIFLRFLPLTKKRYAAWKFERTDTGWKESIEMKGIETVRRDWCPLVGDTVRAVVDILLKKSDVKEAVKFFKVVVNDLVAGKTDLNKLVITKTMTKAASSYDGVQPHIELVKKMEARTPGEAPGIGDRVAYVIIKGTQLISKRTEDPAYVKEKGLQIDASYYIENQLLPPVERLFKVLNVEKSELLGFGKQSGLFDILKPKKEETVVGATWNEVTGFICTKCGVSYTALPLLGVCGCGASLLFSTPRGPALDVAA